MGEYVEIRTSPAEIMGIANGIRGQGEQLSGDVGDISQEIAERENRADTFPPDQFTDDFVAKYKQDVPGADGKTTAANEAVRASAEYCGTKLVEIGDFVGRAMVNYGATDDESGQDIAGAI
jgi:hypothetical protein